MQNISYKMQYALLIHIIVAQQIKSVNVVKLMQIKT